LKLGGDREQLLDGGLLFRIAPLGARGIQGQFGDVGWSSQPHGGKQIVQDTVATHKSILPIVQIPPSCLREFS